MLGWMDCQIKGINHFVVHPELLFQLPRGSNYVTKSNDFNYTFKPGYSLRSPHLTDTMLQIYLSLLLKKRQINGREILNLNERTVRRFSITPKTLLPKEEEEEKKDKN